MIYEIEVISNGYLIKGQKDKESVETSTIFCKTIHIVADVLTSWDIAGYTKAQIRAKKLNIESSYKD